MKKRILSVLAFCSAFFVTTSGTNETNNNNNGNESEITINASEIKDIKGTKGTVSFKCEKGGTLIAPFYNADVEAWVLMGATSGGNSMTITSENPFKRVTFTTTATDPTTQFKYWTTDSSGSSSISGQVLTWTSNSAITTVTFKRFTSVAFNLTSFTVGDSVNPTVSLTNASDSIGGYYKDGDTKKQFVSFGATVTALPEKDLSLVTEYGINVYSDLACSTLVTTKSATIGSGGHTIDELKGQGGRFYTILSSEDGIVDKMPYYAKAYVKESSGASVESSTAMTATADTGGTEYIL